MSKRLLFSPGFPPIIGGQESFMYARCLAGTENLEVIAKQCEGSEAFDVRQDFAIYRFDYPWYDPKFEPLRRALQLQRTASILSQFLGRQRYDVVEVATVFPGAIVAQGLRRRQRDFVLVSYALGDDILRPQRTWYAATIFHRTLRGVDLFVAISRYTKQILVEAGVPSERIVIIHPPLHYERFSKRGDGFSIRAGFPPHDLVLLTICRLVKKKGVDRIIELMPRLRKRFPGLLYIVGGEGEDLPRLQMLATQHEVSGSVIFLGRIPPDKLVDTYAAADLFVMLTNADRSQSEVEGFGIVFLEAGSQGVPVIGPSYGGSTDAILEGVTGYLVDPIDSQELESRIVELLSNPDRRQEMGKEGVRHALEPTDWSSLLNL